MTNVEELERPLTGAREVGEVLYYCPHYPEWINLDYKFRRETPNGTQVRNSSEDDWEFAWDSPISA